MMVNSKKDNINMFISTLIILFSMLLFAYWFRYTCVLILNAKSTKDYTAQVAQANQLEFLRVQSHLQSENATDWLDQLEVSLRQDYLLVTGVLRHAAQFQLNGFSLEQRMLMVDYQLMRAWYSIARRFSQAGHARQALQEMADIVAHFANDMGERAASASRA